MSSRRRVTFRAVAAAAAAGDNKIGSARAFHSTQYRNIIAKVDEGRESILRVYAEEERIEDDDGGGSLVVPGVMCTI